MKKAEKITPSQLAESLDLSEDFKQKIREEELNDLINQNFNTIMGSGEEIINVQESEDDDLNIE